MTESLWDTAIDLAALHLHEKGYILLHKNQSLSARYTVDIVAIKDDVIHFVSVRLIDMNNPDSEFDTYRESPKYLQDVVRNYKDMFHYGTTPHTIDRIAIVYRSVQDYYLQHYENII